MKLRQGTAALLVALLACIAACSARKTQHRPTQGATGQPVEMSSMAITFYNSGMCLEAPPDGCLPGSRAPSEAELRSSRLHGAGYDL